MNSLKFLDGTPVPTEYLAMVSRLVRDACSAIDIVGEDELEAACRSMASSNEQRKARRRGRKPAELRVACARHAHVPHERSALRAAGTAGHRTNPSGHPSPPRGGVPSSTTSKRIPLMSKPDQLIGTVPTAYGMAGIHVGRYPIGGALAVQLYLASGEPLITFSTNLVPYGNWLAEDEFFVKAWSENEPFVQPMLDTGLFEDTGRHVPSGYVIAPIWRIRDADHAPRGRRRPAPAASDNRTACPSTAGQRTQAVSEG